MTALSFVDTNILIYAVDLNPAVSVKRKTALELLATIEFGISIQVLQEFYFVVTRKLTPTIPEKVAFQLVEDYLILPVAPVDSFTLTAGIRNSLQYQISYWDGAILAAAERLHCKILYTEDLNHGQKYGTVEVVNPFI